MINTNRIFTNYLIVLFSIIPISLIIGNAVLEINFFFIIITFIISLNFNRKYLAEIKNDPILILLLLFWIYLIFSTFFSLDYSLSIRRNLFFFKFILLIFSFKYFFLKFNILNKVINAWAIVMMVVSIDIFIEFYSGANLLGFESPMKNERIVSFFKDELIVGSFLFAFLFPVVGTLIVNNKKNIGLTLGILIIICIFISGERSVLIKSTLSIIILATTSFFDKKTKVIILSIFLLTALTVSSNDRFSKRYFSNVAEQYNLDFKNFYNSALETKYLNQSILTYEIFKKNIFFGVGNKNYHKACQEIENKNLSLKCYTHPHQVYYEFLSEHGAIGTLIIMLLLYYLLFKLDDKIENKNIRKKIFIFKLYCLVSLLPILPTGSFFSTLNLSLFWINYSFYEIFKKKLALSFLQKKPLLYKLDK
tara:strand:- start:2509 stop:3771 length:1263 start_codon:yes stop_codon:yes gene_type:complete